MDLTEMKFNIIGFLIYFELDSWWQFAVYPYSP